MQMVKYRKTPHLDDVIRHVTSVTQSVKIGDDWVIDSSITLPVVQAKATVKLHGTNLGVVSDGVINGGGAYTHGDDEYELAIIGKGGELCYDTPITDDVLGHLSAEEGSEVMLRVSQLPSIVGDE